MNISILYTSPCLWYLKGVIQVSWKTNGNLIHREVSFQGRARPHFEISHFCHQMKDRCVKYEVL